MSRFRSHRPCQWAVCNICADGLPFPFFRVSAFPAPGHTPFLRTFDASRTFRCSLQALLPVRRLSLLFVARINAHFFFLLMYLSFFLEQLEDRSLALSAEFEGTILDYSRMNVRRHHLHLRSIYLDLPACAKRLKLLSYAWAGDPSLFFFFVRKNLTFLCSDLPVLFRSLAFFSRSFLDVNDTELFAQGAPAHGGEGV